MLQFDGSKDKPLTKRAKPTLITVGKRQYISSGRWNDDIMCEFALKNGQNKWIAVGALARVAYGSESIANKKQARKRLASLVNSLLLRDHLLIVERGYRGRINRVKLYMGNPVERQVALLQVEDWKKRREHSSEQYDRAIALLLPHSDASSADVAP